MLKIRPTPVEMVMPWLYSTQMGIPWKQAFYGTGLPAKKRWKLILGKWSNQQIIFTRCVSKSCHVKIMVRTYERKVQRCPQFQRNGLCFSKEWWIQFAMFMYVFGFCLMINILFLDYDLVHWQLFWLHLSNAGTCIIIFLKSLVKQMFARQCHESTLILSLSNIIFCCYHLWT